MQGMARPQVTTHAEIESAAFGLFAERGFEATTIQDIADACGIGRRTLLRYFPSKNDIPWGPFDESLARLRATLAAMPTDLPVSEAVQRAVIDFNRLDPGAVPQHRQRMALILGTPVLQAHSAIRYADWRAVVSEFVAGRLGLDAQGQVPRVAGRVALALAVSAYEQWLEEPGSSLDGLLEASFGALAQVYGTGAGASAPRIR
jgi:mycofactocin system transcriptional regulator